MINELLFDNFLFTQMNSLISCKETICPDEEICCLELLVCKNFLKQIVKILLGQEFPGTNHADTGDLSSWS